MSGAVWVLLVFMAIIMWSATSLLYKAGIHSDSEKHTCLKYSVCVGQLFFVIGIITKSVMVITSTAF